MKRVLVLVEGQAEERFVKDVLEPHLSARNIYPTPKVVTTKRVKGGSDFKGGLTGYQKVENDLKRLLQDTAAVSVTTFIDYYALPSDFPGMSTRPNGASLDKAQHVEAEWRSRIDDARFRPYLMVHEFEALLFSKPDELMKALHKPGCLAQLDTIRSSFNTPEDINDNPLTAPSKRIIDLLPGYQKVLHGPSIAKRIGVGVLRSQCPHFNEWLSWFEAL